MFWTLYFLIGLVAVGCVYTLSIEFVKEDTMYSDDGFEVAVTIFFALVLAAFALAAWPLYLLIWRITLKVRST